METLHISCPLLPKWKAAGLKCCAGLSVLSPLRSGLRKNPVSLLCVSFTLLSHSHFRQQKWGEVHTVLRHQLCCAQTCPTLCDSIDCSPPSSSVQGFPRQEYWHGLPFLPPGDLPDPEIKPAVPASAVRVFFTARLPGKLDTSWVLCNLTPFWHHPPEDSIRPYRVRAQSQETTPTTAPSPLNHK